MPRRFRFVCQPHGQSAADAGDAFLAALSSNLSSGTVLRPAHGVHGLCLIIHRRMKITFKLFATLTDYLPADRRYNAVELELDPATTIGDLVTRFQLPVKLVHLVLVNGVYVDPAARASRTLEDGDVLAIWPPVAGG